MTDLERYIQHDLDDLMKSVSHDPMDVQTEAYLMRQAAGLLRYQSEIGTISDYFVDVQITKPSASITLFYKLSPTDDEFREAIGTIVSRNPLAAALPTPSAPQQTAGNYQSSNSHGTYTGGAGHGAYSGNGIGLTGITPQLSSSISAPYIPQGVKFVQSRSPQLPSISFDENDESGALVRMTLAPDWQLTAADSLKLSMLLFSAVTTPSSFSARAFVKANQLERHFNFKAV